MTAQPPTAPAAPTAAETSPMAKVPPAGDGAADFAAAPSARARGLLTVARLMACLPLRLLRAIGAPLGLIVYASSVAYRAKLRGNLARAGEGSHRAAWRAASQAGQMVAELPFIWLRPPEALQTRVVCTDLGVLEAAERSGRGILFLTPHLGSFEATARWYSARAPITVMFRPPRQSLLAPLLDRARNAVGMRAVPAAMSGVRAMLRALRSREAVGLLPDQVPGQGEGRWVAFFGEPAYTMTLPLRLAQASGAAVVMAVGERIPGGWRLHLEALEAPPTPEALNAFMERAIRRLPDQYLWGYNRYKQLPDVPRPER